MKKNKIILEHEIFGKEFIEALVKVLEVRAVRKELYGDTFLNDEILFLKYQVENKLKRFNANLKQGRLINTKDKLENAKDSLIDLINYSIFILAKIERGDKK